MAARRACRSLTQAQQQSVNRGAAMVRIRALCAMSGDRSSRGTRSALSKSAERTRSGDESRKTAHCGSRRVILHSEIMALHDDPHLTPSVPEKRGRMPREGATSKASAPPNNSQNRWRTGWICFVAFAQNRIYLPVLRVVLCSRRVSAQGSPGRAECVVCGGLLESWQEPRMKAYRLVLAPEHKYPRIPAPPSSRPSIAA